MDSLTKSSAKRVRAESVDTAAELVRIAGGDTHFGMMKNTSKPYHPSAKSPGLPLSDPVWQHRPDA
jgi:hypothetical protein